MQKSGQQVNIKKISKKDSIKEAKKFESKESLNGKMSFLKGNVKIAKKKK
jgi:hypothetical protein